MAFWRRRPDADETDRIKFQVLAYLGSAVLVGALFSGLHRSDHWTVILLWDGAGLATGGLVGFLFGIPKTLQSGQSAPEHTTAPALSASTHGVAEDTGQRVNTSLEEISDWLTKIFVGLGLTELRQIPTKLQEAAAYIADGVGGAAEKQFVLALIIYFPVIGFLGAYLLTRLFLQRAFYLEDFWYRLKGKLESAAGRAENVAHAIDVIDTALRNLGAGASGAILSRDAASLETLRAKLPLFRKLHIVLGRIYRKLGDFEKAIALLTEFITQKEQAEELDPDAGAALYNRACYWSLKSQVEADKRKKDEMQHQALADLKRGLSMAPELKPEAAKDEDFASLRSLNEFETLTGSAV